MGQGRSKKGMFEGDLKEGELEVGQVCNIVDELLSTKDCVANLIKEYQEAKDRLL